MFINKWDDISIINHIMSSYGREALNSHYYAMAYPAVYAAAERIFGSWGNAIVACGLDYDSIKKYRSWAKARRKCGIRENYRMYVRRREMESCLSESA